MEDRSCHLLDMRKQVIGGTNTTDAHTKMCASHKNTLAPTKHLLGPAWLPMVLAVCEFLSRLLTQAPTEVVPGRPQLSCVTPFSG